MSENPWFVCPQPAPQALVRLYCFPYAGGGVPVFRAWAPALVPSVEVWIAQLPGRGSRFREPLFDRLPPIVNALGERSFAVDGRPYAFFGHSLGALVAFELARLLRRRGQELPAHIFVAAHPAPQLPGTRPSLHTLPQDQLIAELRSWNGIPVEILDQQEVMDFFLPLLRADLAVAETAVYRPEPPLAMPILAYGGEDDPLVSQEELAAWGAQTSRAFRMTIFPGDHFFLHTAGEALISAVQKTLLLPL